MIVEELPDDAVLLTDGARVEDLGAGAPEISALKAQVKSEDSTVAAVKRRVRERLAERGVDYPDAPRAPFG